MTRLNQYQLWSPGTPGVLKHGVVDTKMSEVQPDFTLRLATEQRVYLHCTCPATTSQCYWTSCTLAVDMPCKHFTLLLNNVYTCIVCALKTHHIHVHTMTYSLLWNVASTVFLHNFGNGTDTCISQNAFLLVVMQSGLLQASPFCNVSDTLVIAIIISNVLTSLTRWLSWMSPIPLLLLLL